MSVENSTGVPTEHMTLPVVASSAAMSHMETTAASLATYKAETIETIATAQNEISQRQARINAASTAFYIATAGQADLLAQLNAAVSIMQANDARQSSVSTQAILSAKALLQKMAATTTYTQANLQELQYDLFFSARLQRYMFYKTHAIVKSTKTTDRTGRCDQRCIGGKGFANSKLYKQKCCGAYICADCLLEHNFEKSSWGMHMYAPCMQCNQPRKIYVEL